MGVHLTPQSRAEIERAEEFHYLMVDELSDSWIAKLNPNSHSLRAHYAPDRKRSETYEAMVEQILASVRAGRRVCAAFYGHPGVCAFPSHEAIRRAREEGFSARMLASVSAEDCLFADLGVDPGKSGCQSYEATDFLLRPRTFDPTAALVLWQVAFIGITQAPVAPAPETFKVLVEYLLEFYDPDHEAVLYEASPYPVGESSVKRIRLGDLADAELGPLATLYLAPRGRAETDPVMRGRLERADVDSKATHVVASTRITASGEEPRSK
jgi:uncharacterized protein YabN with tetrapyrrole methylase and pyrophosphatase domain